MSEPNHWTINDNGSCAPELTSPQAGAVVSVKRPVFTGTFAAPNRTIHIQIGGATHTTTSDGNGVFSFTWPLDLK